MVSLLEGKLKAKIAQGFKGKLTKGVLRRSVATGLDSRGNPTAPTITSFNFEGIRESWSALYKANAGIPDTDVSILILQGSFKPVTVITKADEDAEIFLDKPWNAWFQVRKVLEVDPAGASARLQCYEIPAP